MQKHGWDQCRPQRSGEDVAEEPLIGLSSGYVERARHLFPKQGAKTPWRLHQNYALDLLSLGYGRIDDDVMRFSCATAPAAEGSRKVA
jgi:hypothetical protein